MRRALTPVRRFGLAGVLLAACAWLLVDGAGPVRGEVAATEAANGLPDVVVDGLELAMQLGARPSIVVVAIVVAVLADRGRWRAALLVVLSGALAWGAATLLKDTVERPRPAGIGADVMVRDEADGFAWPSSHVATATGSVAGAALALGRRPEGAVAAGAVVGVARMAVGVHLPLDVLGGLGVGAASAVVVHELAARR